MHDAGALTTETLISLVEVEKAASDAERVRLAALGPEGLVEAGRVLPGLTVDASDGLTWHLSCIENVSRFRTGDRVVLRSEATATELSGLLEQSRQTGLLLDVRLDARATPTVRQDWCMGEVDIDTTGIVLAALRKLHKGGPGWRLFEILRGVAVEHLGRARPTPPSFDELNAAVTGGWAWDDSQRQAIAACLESPPLECIWGPPGTGKTQVLAMVAEGLARAGNRVVITAPTHQAVNNALTTVKTLFPERTVLKVGRDARRESLADSIENIVLRDEMAETPPRLRHESIIGMTFLSSLTNLALRRSRLRPNVMLIDEAGQLPLTQGACAGLCGASSIMLFGDDMQMPPVTPSALVGLLGAESLFERARASMPSAVRRLQVTHRLNRELSATIGDVFYAHPDQPRLTASEKASDRRLVLPRGAAASCDPPVREVLESASAFVWVGSGEGSARDLNLEEAELAAQIMEACLAGGMTSDEVAAVTPYRRQVVEIQRRLQSRLAPGGVLPIIDTVERVQGLTVDCIIVSLCSSDPSYVSSVASFLFSPNRLNVALSRARMKAVILASSTLLHQAELVPAVNLPADWFAQLMSRAGPTSQAHTA